MSLDYALKKQPQKICSTTSHKDFPKTTFPIALTIASILHLIQFRTLRFLQREVAPAPGFLPVCQFLNQIHCCFTGTWRTATKRTLTRSAAKYCFLLRDPYFWPFFIFFLSLQYKFILESAHLPQCRDLWLPLHGHLSEVEVCNFGSYWTSAALDRGHLDWSYQHWFRFCMSI